MDDEPAEADSSSFAQAGSGKVKVSGKRYYLRE